MAGCGVYNVAMWSVESFLACARFGHGHCLTSLQVSLSCSLSLFILMMVDGSGGPASELLTRALEEIRGNQVRMAENLGTYHAKRQEEATTKALKRVQQERSHSFRRKGNEEQFDFNGMVEEAVADAQAKLTAAGMTPVVERARETLKQGMKLLSECQKLVKFADRSKFGWGVISEYTTDDLALDSNDKKCIEKAEKATNHT